MKVLVTGATGFLGSHLIKRLVEDGFEVVILKRTYSNGWRLNKYLDKIVCYDIDLIEIEDVFKKEIDIDIIVHTATIYGRKNDMINDMFDSNVVFPMKLLYMGVKYGVKTFINTDSFFNKEENRSGYLKGYTTSKRHFLEWGRLYSDSKLIQFINVKLEHIYGPNDAEDKFTIKIIKDCISNVPEIKLTLGEQRRDFIYIDDVVSGYLIIINTVKDLNNSYYQYELGTGEDISIREFVELVHRISNSNSVLRFGALEYNANEIFKSSANCNELKKLGWVNKISLENGLKALIEIERKKCNQKNYESRKLDTIMINFGGYND